MNLIKQILIALDYLLIPKSYSQLGEDLVIMNHLQCLGKNPNSKGFYIDIGAYHPLDGSNTYKFYKRGASGITVDIICIELFPHEKWNKVNEYLNSLVNQKMEISGYSLQSICGPTLIYVYKNSFSNKD